MSYYKNVGNELLYLGQFYSCAELDNYAKGNEDKIIKLFNKAQPKKVEIASLKNNMFNKTSVLVSSPDGWVPVTDCLEKIKDSIYKFTFASGVVINASHDHLFQKPDLTWWYARDLYIGDVLLSNNGQDIISDIIYTDKKTKVYDLTVNHDNHRYYTNTICSHNSGKSLFMQNLMVNWTQDGKNCVFITLELSEDLCSMRMDSMMTDTASSMIFKNIDNVEMKVKMLAKKSGKLRIKYMPAQSTVNDIRSYVKELEIQEKIKVDCMCIDYLDLLMPVSTKVSPSDLFVKDKYVSEEIRNLAKELDIIMVTASQLNRSAVEEVEFDHSHISGGISKINTADNVFGIFTSRAMRERGRYQIQLMKTRSSSGVGQKVELEFDLNTLRITDAGLEPDEGSAVSSEIMNKIKPGVASTIDPLQNIPKVSGDVKSAKLQNLLNNIKSK